MLKLPGLLTADTFLQQHWQKQPLYMPGALPGIKPAITRNELGWLATLDDVESRLVFVDRSSKKLRYRVETGPFDPVYLQDLPKRDWTLLVHDVEKHLPAMRALFRHVPFIPQWRIDDLMVSFAAPGGGVGPHRDHYDVFLCQGVGVRNWRFTGDAVTDDPDASDDLALLSEFEGQETHETVAGDVLYLPPGVAHWGTARRACTTYSIGMRAPQAADLLPGFAQANSSESRFYTDTDLESDEATPGFISQQASKRASDLLGLGEVRQEEVSESLGRFATQPKEWLRPERLSETDATTLLSRMRSGARLHVHGMALIAFDQRRIYVNGENRELLPGDIPVVERICAQRSLLTPKSPKPRHSELLVWLLQQGTFETPENF